MLKNFIRLDFFIAPKQANKKTQSHDQVKED